MFLTGFIGNFCFKILKACSLKILERACNFLNSAQLLFVSGISCNNVLGTSLMIFLFPASKCRIYQIGKLMLVKAVGSLIPVQCTFQERKLFGQKMNKLKGISKSEYLNKTI